LRLGIARKDGRPVAAQLWLVENKVATIHKLAHAEEVQPLSPGTVLSMAMFRRALDEDQVEALDYGLGDEAYKSGWIDEARPIHRLIAYDLKSLRGLAAVSRAAASKLVRLRRSG
jgi:CelD/BcsL family acetyltransferase involved in cellulose biosynthesis